LRAFFSLAILGLSALSAAASDITATIRVRIVSPVPLVSIATVELAAWPFSSIAEVSNAERPVMIRALPAGNYRLTVRLSGHRDAAQVVNLGAAAHHEYEVAFRRSDQDGDSTIRLVSSEPVRTVRPFDESLLGGLPVDDPLAAVVETTVAPLIVDRLSNGGLWPGEAALIGGQASSWRNATTTLDDLDVTDPARIGTPLLRPSQPSIAALVVSTTLLPASAGGPGPLLSLVPKPPSTTWKGGGEARFFSRALQSSNTLHGAPPIAKFDRYQDWNGHVAGPIASEAGLFVSARRTASDRIERTDPRPLESRVSSLFGTAAFAAGSRGRVRAVGSVDRVGMPYAGRARFANRDVRETNTFTTAHVSWDGATPSGHLWSASSGLAQGIFTPQFDTGGPSDRIAAAGTVERLLDGPVPLLFDGMPATRRRVTGRVEVAPSISRWRAGHALRAGATISRNTTVTSGRISPPVAELVADLPARIWEYEYRAPHARWASTELAGYLTDRIMLGAKATIDAGVRLESARGSARDATDSISWFSVSPRLSGRWVVARPFAVFGGYARYTHRLALDYLAYGDPGAASGQVYRWQDVNGDRRLQADEYGALVAAVGPCCNRTAHNRIDPDLSRPSTDEGVFGIEMRFAGWSLRISGIKRHERDLIGSVNTGAPESAYVLRYDVDPGEPFRDPPEERPLPVYDRRPSSFGLDQYLLTNLPATVGLYDGIEASIEGSVGGRLRTRFDGTSYQAWVSAGNRGFRPFESDPGVIGELFENPNARTYAYGHGFVDRGYVIKWLTHYAAPRDYVLSAVARYQDGQPFSRLAIIPDLNQGPEAINGYRLGRTRFTFTLTLDTRFEKTVSVAGARVTGVLEVFNLLNMRNEVEEDVRTGPTFRAPTAIQPPRAARIGARIAF
jgi:TonB dependent receptor